MLKVALNTKNPNLLLENYKHCDFGVSSRIVIATLYLLETDFTQK